MTLEDFFKSLIPNNIETFANIGSPMLIVLDIINGFFKETEIYGLTSHGTLLLLNKNSSLSPWFVSIKGIKTNPNNERNEYQIEYLMTKDKQIWENTTVSGTTTSLDKLKKLIIIAMTESEGWKDNIELENLYIEMNRL